MSLKKPISTMRIILFLSVFLLLCSCAKEDATIPFEASESNFLGEVEWVKNYGGSGEDTGQAIIRTSDGGFAILGFSNSLDGDIQDKDMAVNDYW